VQTSHQISAIIFSPLLNSISVDTLYINGKKVDEVTTNFMAPVNRYVEFR